MIKELKYGGMASVPSDYECPDGQLAVAVNVVNENGEIKPFIHPDPFMNIIGELLFVHKSSNYENFITIDDGNLWWQTRTSGREVISPVGTVTKIEAIGNTLVIISDQSLSYLLWVDGAYKSLGSKPPELKLSFGLQGEVVKSTEKVLEGSIPGTNLSVDQRKALASAEIAEINPFIQKEAIDKGRFLFPFLIRYAFRMYDGTLSMHSSPILMLPSAGEAPFVVLNIQPPPPANISFIESFHISAFVCNLDFVSTNVSTEISEWSEIIQGVDIFISAPIYTYDQNGTEANTTATRPGQTGVDTEFSVMKTSHNEFYEKKHIYAAENTQHSLPPLLDLEKIAEQVDTGLLYKVKSLTIEEVTKTTTRTKIEIEPNVLETLQMQEQMTDDYNSHNQLQAGVSYTYNARLNIAGIKQRMFDGFAAEAQTTYQNFPNPLPTDIYVFIKKDGREMVLKSAGSKALGDSFGYYLYYPDPAAYRMVIQRGGQYADIKLEPHPAFNGAFYFNNFAELPWSAVVPTGLVPTADPTVTEPNKLYTSEVNNPFVFPVAGITTIGTSEIVGLASSTRALSQGQFGQFPLYVFTGEGIWALEVSAAGTYSSRQMVARDVCNNAHSITQIDGAVVFTTDQGVMLIQGAEISNISRVLSGATFSLDTLLAFDEVIAATGLDDIAVALRAMIPFEEYMSGCAMAFDYANRRLMVFNDTKPYAYIFSLRDGLWSIATSDYIGVANNYPDSYLTHQSGGLSNLSEIISPDDARTVQGLLITRPLKLDAPDVLKTVSTVAQKGQLQPTQVKQVLYGSRDGATFQPLASSTAAFIRRAAGTPYKQFRLVVIPSLTIRDSLSKAVIEFNLKYTNKLR